MEIHKNKDINKIYSFRNIMIEIKKLFNPSFDFWYDYTLGDEYSFTRKH